MPELRRRVRRRRRLGEARPSARSITSYNDRGFRASAHVLLVDRRRSDNRSHCRGGRRGPSVPPARRGRRARLDAGPATRLAESVPARSLAPTHPGFALTDRPEELASIADLARLYAALLERLVLEDVTVVGNSIGGWIAAELALLQPRALSRLILIDAVGIDVSGHPVTDVAGLSVPEIMKLSFHDPAPFLRDPSTLSAEQQAALVANQRALAAYAPSMTDSTLAKRLGALAIPTCVLWGRSDGIVDVEYGRAYAEAIRGARFEVLEGTGHMPQLETPDLVIEAIAAELGARQRRRTPAPNDRGSRRRSSLARRNPAWLPDRVAHRSATRQRGRRLDVQELREFPVELDSDLVDPGAP